MKEKKSENKQLWRSFRNTTRSFRVRPTRRLCLTVFCVTLATTSYFLVGAWIAGAAGAWDLDRTNLLIQFTLHDSILNEKGTGCEVPRLDPFSEESIRDDYDGPKVQCEGTDWVRCHVSKCTVIEEILKKYKDIYCIYKDILYINDNEYELGEPVKIYGNDSYTLNKSDHVTVSCTGIEKGAFLPSGWSGHNIGLRVLETQTYNIAKQPFRPCEGLNVMILCFHSASRHRFTRRMPKSLKVLTEELNATFFDIHTVVGDGTAAALIPLMTGKSEVELPDSRRETSKEFINVKNFIFNLAKENGFRTSFLEDVEYVGTFQNRYNGFSQQPADHYLRAFHLEAIQNGKWLSSYAKRHCIGSTPLHKKILELTQQIPKIERKYFCFSSIGQIYHDPYSFVSTVDDDVVAFLRDLRQSGALRNTMLMIVGDHGPRFGQFRETYQGKLEERLPLMALVLPTELKECRHKIAAVIEANSRVLTTHYDVYATALDAMGLREHTDPFIVRGASSPRAMSLLRPIPKNRTCGEAGVLPHWCVCSKWVDVPKEDPMHITVASILAGFINNLTSTVRSDCVIRNLTNIVWVMRQSMNDDVLSKRLDGEGTWVHSEGKEEDRLRPRKEYYQVKIEMSPMRAAFEGTVAHGPAAGSFSLLPEHVSRVTAYSDESRCVRDTHPDLEKYCHCQRNVKFTYKTFNVGIA